LVPPHHPFPEKPQVNRRIEYLDPTVCLNGPGASFLAQRMGHSDPAMTLRLYGHLFEGRK
jgi:integrase